MNRKRPWPMLLCLLTGCSTHPLVDFCDFVRPGKLGPTTVQPYGGVAIPQGPIMPGAPIMPVVGVPVPFAPGGAVVPPPIALPGNAAPGFPLQPPTPGGVFPPLPPNPPLPKF